MKLCPVRSVSRADSAVWGQVLITLFCVTFGLQSVSMIAMYLPDSASGAVAATEVFRLVDLESKIDAVEPHGEITSLGDGTLRLEDMSL